MKFILILPVFFYSQVQGEPLTFDQQLSLHIKKYSFEALKRFKLPKKDSQKAKIQLGAALFGEMELSIPQVKSCFHCHQPMSGTANNVPFSPGIGKRYPQAISSGQYPNAVVPYWQQRESILSKRKSPALLNLGHKVHTSMFHDGRVYWDKKSKRIVTPDENLNEGKSGYKEIRDTLDSIISAQSLFPMVDKFEMRGQPLNYRPDLKTNLDVWNEISSRIVSNPTYHALLKEAYPNVSSSFNIGHIANSLGAFQKIVFQTTETPWDRYLRGDSHAMTAQQKRGAILFSGKANCATYHSGKNLSDFSFQNVLVPLISQESYGQGIDYGRYDFSKKESDKFKFKTPSLRFLSKRDPYFHNGFAQTLEEVVDHYMSPETSFKSYKATTMTNFYFQWGIEFTKPFVKVGTAYDSKVALKNKSRRLSPILNLTENEKQDLIVFLREGLSGTPIVKPENLPRLFGARYQGEQAFEVTQVVLDLITPYIDRNLNYWDVPGPHEFYCYSELNNFKK